MGIVIIGASGHGRHTLALALAQIAHVQCEVLETKDFIKVAQKQQPKAEELATDLVLNTMEFPKKKERVKTWDKTKFYQR